MKNHQSQKAQQRKNFDLRKKTFTGNNKNETLAQIKIYFVKANLMNMSEWACFSDQRSLWITNLFQFKEETKMV